MSYQNNGGHMRGMGRGRFGRRYDNPDRSVGGAAARFNNDDGGATGRSDTDSRGSGEGSEGRYGGRGRGHRPHGSRDGSQSSGTDRVESRGHRGGGPSRHPAGLKGREIGLWYAKKSQGKNKELDKELEKQNRSRLRLNEDQAQHLTNLLTSLRSGNSSSSFPRESSRDDDHKSSVRSDGTSDRHDGSRMHERDGQWGAAGGAGAQCGGHIKPEQDSGQRGGGKKSVFYPAPPPPEESEDFWDEGVPNRNNTGTDREGVKNTPSGSYGALLHKHGGGSSYSDFLQKHGGGGRDSYGPGEGQYRSWEPGQGISMTDQDYRACSSWTEQSAGKFEMFGGLSSESNRFDQDIKAERNESQMSACGRDSVALSQSSASREKSSGVDKSSKSSRRKRTVQKSLVADDRSEWQSDDEYVPQDSSLKVKYKAPGQSLNESSSSSSSSESDDNDGNADVRCSARASGNASQNYGNSQSYGNSQNYENSQNYGNSTRNDDDGDCNISMMYKKEDDEDVLDFNYDDIVSEYNQSVLDQERNPYFAKNRLLERDEGLDMRLWNQQQEHIKNPEPAFTKMMAWRTRLPSYQMKQELIDTIQSNQVVVVSGETGCGKTTQVTQFILDDYIEKGNGSLCRIVCTQPRRISAISVAERVADERGEPIGRSVGYQIRLDDKLPRSQGSILYCTVGILLRCLISDPSLCSTTHVILDEVHERDVLTDFLMIILKDLTLLRPDLRVILMSATLNAEQFSQYFNNCVMLNIPGFTFPVEHIYLHDIIEKLRYVPHAGMLRRLESGKRKDNKLEQEYQAWTCSTSMWCSMETIRILRSLPYDPADLDYDLITHVVRHLVYNTEDGAILIFVPGWEQIRKTIDTIQMRIKCLDKLRVIPLHSLMPTVNQREVFDRPPEGMRKIIVATNIAETSITIDDVVYVIDTGKIKMKNYDANSNLSTLSPEWISRANAKQRAGRAGRVQKGECYHLYTTFHESKLADYQLPEMMRTRLEELCLQIKLLKLGRIEEFVSKALQPPEPLSLRRAVDHLRTLNALDSSENLTALGYHLAKMPVDPQTGKMLLFGALFSCLDPILTIAASVSFKDAFYAPLGKEQIVDERKKELARGTNSDHLLMLYAYQGWENAWNCKQSTSYCNQNFLSFNTLKMLKAMRQQFATMLHNMKFIESPNPRSPQSNRNSGNTSLIKAVISAGLYPNVAKIKPKRKPNSRKPHRLSTPTERRVGIHPKSVNSSPETKFNSQWLVYHLIMKTATVNIYDCTSVSPYPLLFFGGNVSYRMDLGEKCCVVDDWISIPTSKTTATLVMDLRRELERLMRHKISSPGVIQWNKPEEGHLMNAIIDLITMDHEQHFPGRN